MTNEERKRRRETWRRGSAKYFAKPENKERKAEYYAKPENKKRQAEYNRHRNYGLIPVEYNFMLASQNFRCDSCGTDDSGARGWHVDHCHVTGEVRGILCHKCNSGIGMLGDTAAGVRRGLAYLERFECRTTNRTQPTLPTAGQKIHSPHTELSETPRPGWSAGLL